MRILMVCKYPPIQGGVSADSFWTAQLLTELGHEVQVLTNAQEVEPAYRIKLNNEDESLLTGFRIPNSIVVRQSHIDGNHSFIPANNPSVSKLVGIGLEAIRTFRPDIIWAHYIEPYGVVALFLSLLTDTPFIIRHSGSDIGRLMPTEQLQPLYRQVFRQALFVMTSPSKTEFFEGIGLRREKIAHAVRVSVPGDLFYPSPLGPTGDTIRLGVYGKTGPAKGTLKLLEALSALKGGSERIRLSAHWGGKGLSTVQERIRELGLVDSVTIEGYVPHWRMASFIRSCDAIVFLENNFPITFHAPTLPLEALCCGRPLLTTEEIVAKQPLLLQPRYCVAVPSDPLTVASIVTGIRDLTRRMRAGYFEGLEWPDSGLIGARTSRAMMDFLAQLAETLRARRVSPT